MWRPIFDTKSAARSWVVRAERHLDHGHVPDCICVSMAERCTGETKQAPFEEPPQLLADTLTLAAWRERWWPTYCRSTRKAIRSVAEADRRWRLHVEPRWGGTLLSAFDRLDIQDWVDEDLAGWRAAATVELIYKDLQLLLASAVDHRPPILGYNPCYKIRLPEGDGAEAVYTDTTGIAGIARGASSTSTWCGACGAPGGGGPRWSACARISSSRATATPTTTGRASTGRPAYCASIRNWGA
ncbi:hypothetical protein E7Y31_16090 [Candidatus Frankia alpina]|uniref:Uncharacterized protein n=2 Tax=Candidatus Frankia alpina TaxID=2699483 RepID=A0A4S5ECW4_9ACTN|nr:hypothetical protein E7Y31_16090 [Candidatus Frankia alpina]